MNKPEDRRRPAWAGPARSRQADRNPDHFFSGVTEGLQSPGVRGRHSIAGALDRLLQGSTLTFRVINQKTIEIRPATSAELQALAERHAAAAAKPKSQPGNAAERARTPTVEKAASLEEVIVNGMAEGLVATRTATPLREIPQTISIISQEQMRQQNDTDLADALSNAVGITAVQNTSLEKTFFSRGFEVSTYHLDGGAALNSFLNLPIFGTPDLGEFDHIEVLRSLVLYGINQHGIAVTDPSASQADQQRFGPLCCSLPNGSNRSEGVDAELSGALTPGWLVGAGYTFNINRAEGAGDLSSQTPRHLLKLWTSSQLSGGWSRWTLGGNLYAQSRDSHTAVSCRQPDGLQCDVPVELIELVQGSYMYINLRCRNGMVCDRDLRRI